MILTFDILHFNSFFSSRKTGVVEIQNQGNFGGTLAGTLGYATGGGSILPENESSRPTVFLKPIPSREISVRIHISLNHDAKGATRYNLGMRIPICVSSNRWMVADPGFIVASQRVTNSMEGGII